MLHDALQWLGENLYNEDDMALVRNDCADKAATMRVTSAIEAQVLRPVCAVTSPRAGLRSTQATAAWCIHAAPLAGAVLQALFYETPWRRSLCWDSAAVRAMIAAGHD